MHINTPGAKQENKLVFLGFLFFDKDLCTEKLRYKRKKQKKKIKKKSLGNTQKPSVSV